MTDKKRSTKVVTGVVRLSYANVWEPTSINGGTPKYSVSLIIPKNDSKTLDAINAAIEGLKIGDYAKLTDLNAAVERITALETALANVYTKDEAEAKFMDEGEAQAIADAAADAAEAAAKSHAEEKATAAETAAKAYTDEQLAAATATDEEVNAMLGEVFGE